MVSSNRGAARAWFTSRQSERQCIPARLGSNGSSRCVLPKMLLLAADPRITAGTGLSAILVAYR